MRNDYDETDKRPRQFWLGVAAVLITLLGLLALANTETVDAGNIMVLQDQVTGKITTYNQPGIVWQGFGSATHYKKRDQYEFADTTGIKVMFNDGGVAHVVGSVSWEMPQDDTKLVKLHSFYRSQDSVESHMVKTALDKAVMMSGLLMSSTESYASRRAEFPALVEDQLNHGIYKTVVKEERVPDTLNAGQDRIVKTVLLLPSVKPGDHGFERQGPSPLEEFGVIAFNLSFRSIEYSPEVNAQIRAQQQAVVAVQTAKANAVAAEQDLQTTIMKGKADAAKAEWAQKVINAQILAEATQKAEVAEIKAKQEALVLTTTAQGAKDAATLDAETAELVKAKNIAEGEGEAKKRELIQAADGGLEKKLATYEKVNAAYATAISQCKGALVPAVVMGNSSGTTNSVQDIISLFAAKTAKELSLDMGLPTNKQ